MRHRQIEIDLVLAVLRDDCPGVPAAIRVLAAVAAARVDLLDYCAHRYGLGTRCVGERAARWAGCAFAPRLPDPRPGMEASLPALDDIGQCRSLRMDVGGRDITFVAPQFHEVLELRALAGERPEVAGQVCLAPRSEIERVLLMASEERLLHHARQDLVRRWPRAAAAVALPLGLRVGFVVGLMALVGAVLGASAVGVWPVLPLFALFLLLPGLARLLAAMPVEAGASPGDPPLLDDARLPIYSVLVPLRDEAHMVPQLRKAMQALDYPPEKLDIRFVVEAASTATRCAVAPVLADPRFSLVVVPDRQPRTKPKALDYALPTVRGELVVVYDAEDVPAPDQLRVAASHFAARPRIACLQAELVADNAAENALTALFAGEYAGLFGRLLPALVRWRLPVPLGGTSNHFRLRALRRLGGWDAFNVTEDADLGIRLARAGLRTASIASRTYEEAPITGKAWMAQRTRWAKGWMQTLLVHNQAPGELLRDLGWRRFIAFEIMGGSMVLSSLLHTVFLLSLLINVMLHGSIDLFPADGWGWISAGVLAVGYGGALALVVSGVLRLGRADLLPVQLLLPVYWLLHSVAAIRAAIDLIRRPHFWAKTEHGLTAMRRRHEAPGQPASTARSAPAQAE
jgi:cellulose synthase/poly-beta-1,6-N-acetylglucosamine synthase-like glycosyltransferase